MKKKYDQFHSRRITVGVRMRKEYAEKLKEAAKIRRITLSKLMDKCFWLTVLPLKREQEAMEIMRETEQKIRELTKKEG